MVVPKLVGQGDGRFGAGGQFIPLLDHPFDVSAEECVLVRISRVLPVVIPEHIKPGDVIVGNDLWGVSTRADVTTRSVIRNGFSHIDDDEHMKKPPVLTSGCGPANCDQVVVNDDLLGSAAAAGGLSLLQQIHQDRLTHHRQSVQGHPGNCRGRH